MIRAAGEGQGVLRDPHQHGVIVGVDLETGQQRHLVTMSGIGNVPAMDQRIIGITNVQSILPQKMWFIRKEKVDFMKIILSVNII